MKVTHFSTSDNNGGAAMAARELAEALSHRVNSSLVTQKSKGGLSTEIFIGLKRKVSRLVSFVDPNGRRVYSSYAIFSSYFRSLLSRKKTDIVHLHWVQGEFLSVEDIGNADAPIVWTLHDGWQFLNGPHHDSKYLTSRVSDKVYEDSSMISRWMKRRKLRSWTQKMYLVAPSEWIASQAMKATINRGNSVTVIPNMIDDRIFNKRCRSTARSELGLRDDLRLILVGSLAKTSDPIKGFDLLVEALEYLSDRQYRFKCLYIGSAVDIPQLKGHIKSMGSINSRERMAEVYAACDVVCVPSRIETHSMVAAEAISCGRPVAAFDIGGNPEIIEHKRSGYLAEAFNVESLARGILYCIDELDGVVSDEVYRKHVSRHKPDVIIDQYIRLYSEILELGES